MGFQLRKACAGGFTPYRCRILFTLLKKSLLIVAPLISILGFSVASAKLPEVTEVKEEITVVAPTETAHHEPPAVEEPVEEPRYMLPNASYTEQAVLNALQDRGITDKNALATIMGNIKQESRFHSNICEGGARVGFWSCRRGGYGLIQWTTVDRYNGLAQHARRLGHDPSTVKAQVSYIFAERQWKLIEPSLKQDGRSIQFYMQKAYRWLGWGHHGARTHYAYQYARQLTLGEVVA